MSDEWEKEKAERDRIETAKEKTILERNRGYTALIWCAVVAAASLALFCATGTYALIRYVMPAVKAWKDSSELSAQGVPDLVKHGDDLLISANDPQNGIPGVLKGVKSELDSLKKTTDDQNTNL